MVAKLKENIGLSPRGRGNHPYTYLEHNTARSIPAWAGEPRHIQPECDAGAVYPRVGGGTSS